MKTSHSVLSSLGLASLLLAGCDLMGTDSSSGNDSLDAQAGKDRFNNYDFLQGNLEFTGRVLDLAIVGSGLFILKNKDQYVYFRRPAGFIHDAEGYLSLGNEMTRLQGMKLYSDQDPYPGSEADSMAFGNPKLTDLVDVRWPFNEVAPPRATSELRLSGNLDSDALGKGSIVYSLKFLHHAEGSDLLVGLSDAGGAELGIRSGDVLTFSAETETMGAATKAFAITQGSTMTDLSIAITAFLRGPSVNAGLGTVVDMVTGVDQESLRGALTLYGNSAAIRNFQVTSNRPVSGPKVAKAYAVPSLISAGAIRMAVTTGTLRAPAQPADPLGELYDADGNGLGLESGDVISFSGSLGSAPAGNVSPLIYAEGFGRTTMQAVLDRIRDNFKLADRDGTVANPLSVALNAAGSDDDIPDGSIVVRGRPETASAIKEVTVRSTDFNNAKPTPTFFNTNMNMTTLRKASDDKVFTSAVTVYDQNGGQHVVTLTFTPTVTPDLWLWSAQPAGEETVVSGNRGRVSFGPDGSVSGFTIDGGGTHLEFDPGSGMAPVRIALKAGGPGDFTGLTQFRTDVSLLAGQNGFPAGTLMEISMGNDGIISGHYSNEVSRHLFLIPLADFPNKQGLKPVGEHSFVETVESGLPLVFADRWNPRATLAPGALEASPE